jgi:hypothetical protein
MRVTPAASLASALPSLAAEWHEAKNGRLTPRDVTPTTTRIVWWRCSRSPAHEWRSSILKRASGRGCPACAAENARNGEGLAGRRPYALCLDSDRDRRLALVLFFRSRDIDVLGARDAVEARHHVKAHGEPTAIVVADELSDATDAFPGVRYRAVPTAALRTWLANLGATPDAPPTVLEEVASFVAEELRRASP